MKTKNSEIIFNILKENLNYWVSTDTIIKAFDNLSIDEAREVLNDLIRAYNPVIEYCVKNDCYRLRGELPPEPKWVNELRPEFNKNQKNSL